jgi:hypothetical protein
MLYAMIYGRGSEFAEIKALGESLLEQARRLTPGIFTDFENRRPTVQDIPKFNYTPDFDLIKDEAPVELLSYTPNAAKVIARAALIESCNLPTAQIEKITDNELEFYLAFGLMLQLVDDIQDISEDMGESQTLMTLANSENELENATNKLFNFTHTYMTRYLSGNKKIQEFFVPLAELAVLSAVMRSSKYYSKEYLQRLKKHFPA